MRSIRMRYPAWTSIGGMAWIAPIENVDLIRVEQDPMIKVHLDILIKNKCEKIRLLINISDRFKETLMGIL